jgi:RNA methyltransferase, TrmH family
VTSEVIRSLQNPRVKRAVRLREARERRHSGLMMIDGPREIHQAIAGRIAIEELFVREDFETASMTFDTETLHTTRVSDAVFERLSYGERDSQIVAIAKQPSMALEDLKPLARRRGEQELRLVLVIDRVEKPGNLGAMLRTADAVGVSAVLLSDPICEIWNPNAIRASLGGIFRVPLAIGASASIIEWLKTEGFEILAARVQASKSIHEGDMANHVAIVVGSEADGLGEPWLEPNIRGVRLPMQGSVDSLNVSVSAAVLLYTAAHRMAWFGDLE